MNFPDHGALVISLDFELHWGLRDRYSLDECRQMLLGARRAIPRMLELFSAYDVGATWATVGMLFATGHEDWQQTNPVVRPAYEQRLLSPFDEPVGEDERDDPFHFARSLIETIVSAERQELASHTYSHLYALEPPRSRRALEADLQLAQSLAARHGLQLGSLVFPRNQCDVEAIDVLSAAGFRCYRGNPEHWMFRAGNTSQMNQPARRAARLVDSYTGIFGEHTFTWQSVKASERNGVFNVPASMFLRPYSARRRWLEELRARRIVSAMRRAAQRSELFHLWWHPHNFGEDVEENLAFLDRLLRAFATFREQFGFRSLTMAEVAERVVQKPATGGGTEVSR